MWWTAGAVREKARGAERGSLKNHSPWNRGNFISPAQCERRYVSGTLTFSKSGEPPTDTLHLLVRPPEPQWDYVEHNVLRYNLPIFIDPHEGLPRLEVESDGKYWPKTFVLTPGRHNPDSDPYTVTPDSTDPRTIVISSYELQSK